jgi:hypothetical protein
MIPHRCLEWNEVPHTTSNKTRIDYTPTEVHNLVKTRCFLPRTQCTTASTLLPHDIFRSNGTRDFSGTVYDYLRSVEQKPHIAEKAQSLARGTAQCPIARQRIEGEVSLVACCYCLFDPSSLSAWLSTHNVCPMCRKQKPEVVFFPLGHKLSKLETVRQVLKGEKECFVVCSPEIDFCKVFLPGNVLCRSSDAKLQPFVSPCCNDFAECVFGTGMYR